MRTDRSARFDVSTQGITRRSLFAYTGATGAAALLATTVGPAPALAVTDYDGVIYDTGGEVFNVRATAYGAKGNTIVTSGATISSGSTALTAASATFASGDVGKLITIQGAGASGAVLSTTISAYTDATHVTLAASAQTSVSGAAFAFGTNDTTAIGAAVTAAGANGTVFLPAGIYMINGSIQLTSSGGFVGSGGGSDTSASAVLLCASATAGVLTTGSATYRGFRCDGNHIATTPLQQGQATTAGSGSTFIDVWTVGSTANGWTILGTQDCSYYSCGSIDSSQDGLYIDAGASGLEFWGWTESGSGRHGVRGATDVTGGTGTLVDRTERVRFFGGALRSTASTGVSKVHLRGASDWNFVDVTVKGSDLSGPTVDLDQSAGNALSFARCRISAAATKRCIQVSGTPPTGAAAVTFVTTDAIRFLSGDSSVYLAAVGAYRYSALDWVCDDTTNGPVAATGLAAIETLLEGQRGPWRTATLNSPWTGTASYRSEELGDVRLRGSVSGSTGALFTLPAGYRPAAAVQMPAAHSTGFTSLTVGTDGVVSVSPPSGSTVYLDGIRFPVD